MSKIYSTTMLVIFNHRMKISGGRFDQEENEECALTSTMLSREERRESWDSSTKILVSNGRLTFQLAKDVSPTPSVENSQSSHSVRKRLLTHIMAAQAEDHTSTDEDRRGGITLFL